MFNIYHTWRVTWSTLPSSLKTLRLFFHELRVITFPIDYRWKCVRRPFCFMQIIMWKLKNRLGNRAHCIQHAWIVLKSLVSHFYPKMHLTCTILRNASRLLGYPMLYKQLCNIGRQWRNSISYLRQLVFVAILRVKLSEMFLTVISLNYAVLVSWWSQGHCLGSVDSILFE